MLCDICHKNHAIIHITEIVNNVKKELHVCEECAKQKGLSDKITFSVSNVLGGIIDQKTAKMLEKLQSAKCSNCGMTYQVLRTKVRLGCANDLEVFKEWLVPFIEKIHNSAQHVGRVPLVADERIKRENDLLKLKKELEDAVTKEDYEKAAKLRDKIRIMEIEMSK